MPSWTRIITEVIFISRDLILVFGTTFDLSGQINDVCSIGKAIFYDGITTVVGEFSGARTDCTKYLNGYRYGARYDGTYNGNVSAEKYSSDNRRMSATVPRLTYPFTKKI
jgi:aryl-phospho-beta-D-glucosidase BglC (GH1 family)